jgi:hypothetical protein
VTDPILVKAVRELRQQLKRVPDATREEKDGFLRARTEGKYGFADYIKLVTSIDTDVTPRNVGRSAAQGALAEWADELAGLAGGNAEEMRLRDEMFHGAHPKTDAAFRIGGAVAAGLAVPGTVGARTIGQAAGRGALIGGLYGGAQGAGAGETTEERVTGGARGAGLGAVSGAVLPAVVGTGRLATSPVARAERRVAHAVKKSGGPAGVQQALQRHVDAGRGDDVMLGDLSDRLRAEADFAANANDDVLTSLAERVRSRQANANDRVLQDVKDVAPSGDANHVRRLEQLKDQRLEWANSPEGFAGLRERGKTLAGQVVEDSEQGVMMASPYRGGEGGEDLASLLNQPKVRQAWRDAQEAGLIGKERDLSAPSFEKLQNVKFDLDDAVEEAFKRGKTNLARRLKDAREVLETEMETRLPGYRAVNAQYAAMKRVERALEDGAEAWRVNDSRKLAEQIKGLSPEELSEFRYGMASQLLEDLRGAALNRSKATEFLNGGATMQKKLEVVFDNKKTFDAFMARVASEAELAKMRGPVGGSATARRLTAQGFDPAEIALNSATGGFEQAALGAVARAGRGALARRTAGAEGPMLMTQGAPAIQAMIDSWAKKGNPIMSALWSSAFPAGIQQTPGLLR